VKRRTLWINLGIGALIVVIIALIVASLQSGEGPSSERTVTVSRGDISATVTASGTVERAGVVNLSFGTPGTITSVDVAPGDRVDAGRVLATIDGRAALQQLAAAESTLAQAVQAATSTDASVASASASLADARRVAEQTNKRNRLTVDQARESLAAAEALWDDACLDVNNPTCPNPAAQARLRAAEASIATAQRAVDAAAESAANNAVGYEIAINQAAATLAQRQAQQSTACDGSGTTSGCQAAQLATLTAQQTLENAQRAKTSGSLLDSQTQQTASLNLASANVALQQAQGEFAKAGQDAVRSARQTLDSAERTLRQGRVAGEQSVRAAQAALQSALSSEQTIEIPGKGEVTAAQAAIAAAETGVTAAQVALDDTRLIAPVSGTVGQVPYVVGELATSTATSGGITVIPDGPLEVVADFAESDAAGIAVGAEATVTFDALAGDQAKGNVIAVDPVATTSASGLITYSVRVQVTDPPDAVREGMTASVSVLINEVADALIVPQGAITGSGDRATVLLQKPDGSTEATRITIGLQGDGGTEVTGGVREGDVLVIPSADDLSFPEGGVPGSGRDDDPDGPFGGGGD
jgi:HlyD family secretion protein